VKRVLKVIGKNEGKKNADYVGFYKDFGEYFVVVNLACIYCFLRRFHILMVNLQ